MADIIEMTFNLQLILTHFTFKHFEFKCVSNKLALSLINVTN